MTRDDGGDRPRPAGRPPVAPWLIGVALVVAATVPFLATLDGELVWDDHKLIAEDHRFYQPSPIRALLTSDFFGRTEEPFRYGYLRPLVSLSYYATWVVAGVDPLPYRLTNLALHALATLLVWVATRRLVPGDPLAAALGGLLFALHPVHAESVAWISGRTDLLCTVLVLPAVTASAIVHGARVGWRATVAACALCGLAVWAKEMAVAVPLALLVFLPLVRPTRRAARWALLAFGCGLASLPYLAFRLLASEVGVHGLAWDPARLPRLLWTFLATFAAYAGELVWPRGARPYIQNPWRDGLGDPAVLAGAVLVAALAAAVLSWRCRLPAMAWLGALFAVSFVPIANILRITGPVDMGAPMAQRFLYLPSVPFCIAAGVALATVHRLASRAGGASLWAVLGLGAALALGGLTAQAAATWTADGRLFARIVADAPTAPLPRMLLGAWHRRHGRPAEAVGELETALRLLPPSEISTPWGIHNELAGAWLSLGRCDLARQSLSQAGGQGSPFASIHSNWGLYHRLCGTPGAAEGAFDRALELAPWHHEARLMRALLLLELNRPAAANEDLALLAARGFDHPLLVPATADAFVLRGLPAAARTTLEQALEQRPDDVELLVRLAALVPAARSRSLVDRAARLAPDDPRVVALASGAARTASPE